MANMKLTILGSSAGMPQPNRNNSGYLVQINGHFIQFDCGGGISSAFRKAGFDPLVVERIVISHGHPDHNCDLPLFIQMLYLAGRQEPIDIHLPDELIEPFRAHFISVYLWPEKMPFEINFRPIPAKGEMRFDGYSIQPIPNSHLSGRKEIIDNNSFTCRMECYSFLIRSSNGKSLLYSADLGSEDDIIPYFKDIDLLLVESTHIDVTRTIEEAINNNVGGVVLTHIDEGFDTDGAIQTAKKLGMDNFAIAHDGMVVSV